MAKREYIKANKDWLEVKAKEEGVKALPKGIYYKVLSEGNQDRKKEPVELLDLMKAGAWLIAKEALSWGFVDVEDKYAITQVEHILCLRDMVTWCISNCDAKDRQFVDEIMQRYGSEDSDSEPTLNEQGN